MAFSFPDYYLPFELRRRIGNAKYVSQSRKDFFKNIENSSEMLRHMKFPIWQWMLNSFPTLMKTELPFDGSRLGIPLTVHVSNKDALRKMDAYTYNQKETVEICRTYTAKRRRRS